MSAASRAGALLLLVVALLALRLVTLGVPPLFDKTEGRYGEIGREMAASGDYITPTLHGGEPFWAKPPLHFWMTAASIRLFGVNEWAARLPSFVAAALLLVVTARAGREIAGPDGARLAAIFLGSSALLVLLAGAVLLDVTFTLTVTGALVMYLVLRRAARPRPAGLAFFLFVALGLLAKGPVAIVLVALPIALHSLAIRSRPRLPWAPGALLVVVVAAPWFLLAERKTPGFWNYFFVHEHLLRYLRPEYGDRYGHGHVSPYGLIWLLGFVAFLPWTPALLGLARRAWRSRRAGGEDDTARLLWYWGLTPLVFFTFSRSLSLPYVFPALPAFALLLARDLARGEGEAPRWSPLFAAAVLTAGALFAKGDLGLTAAETARLAAGPALLAALALGAALRGGGALRLAAGVLVFPVAVVAVSLDLPRPLAERNSTRALARAVATSTGREDAVFFDGVPPSAEFYFGGRVTDLKGDAALVGGAAAHGAPLVVREDRLGRLGGAWPQDDEPAAVVGRYRVFRRPPAEGEGQ